MAGSQLESGKSGALELGPMITDKHFADWHADVFGYGYGSGEEFWIPALHRLFCELMDEPSPSPSVHNYSIHERLEPEFGGLAAWLLINTLCAAGIFEYGTSPRYGWTTAEGEMLGEYIATHSVHELLEVLGSFERDDHCRRGWCDETGTNKNCNPLWGPV